jgi:hypothetical protein
MQGIEHDLLGCANGDNGPFTRIGENIGWITDSTEKSSVVHELGLAIPKADEGMTALEKGGVIGQAAA